MSSLREAPNGGEQLPTSPDVETSPAYGESIQALSVQLATLLQTQPPGWRQEKHRLKRLLQRARHDPRQSPSAQDVDRVLPKDTVVGCRVDAVELDAIDTLVEAGIRSTRSDAASWFIREGINAQQGLLQEVRTTVDEIRRLRAQAQAKIAPPVAREPPATSQDGGW